MYGKKHLKKIDDGTEIFMEKCKAKKMEKKFLVPKNLFHVAMWTGTAPCKLQAEALQFY